MQEYDSQFPPEEIIAGLDEAQTNLAEFPQLRAKALKLNDLRLAGHSDPIADVLPQEFRLHYLTVKKEVRQGLVEGLRGVARWSYPGSQKINPDFQENDLEHVLEMLSWCNEIEKKYPALAGEIRQGNYGNWYDLLSMIIVHDIGEIRLGDVVVPEQKTADGKKKKMLEPRWARYAIRKTLPAGQSEQVLGVYNRFETVQEQDRVAMLAKVLDKAQASANVARHVLPFNPDKQDYIFVASQMDTLRHVEKLLPELDEPARRQLMELVWEKVVTRFEIHDLPEQDRLKEQVRESELLKKYLP
jgi:5'-deoxynucleotidase YfbR-like HD superfamily hydrolase